MRFDSDAIITTSNPVILRNTRKEMTIVCDQQSTPKEIITEAKLKKANKNGFGNDVGTITNEVTTMFDVKAGLVEGSPEYMELMDRIYCGQAYQQESIDKIKGIKAKTMPKSWYDYKTNKIKVDKETGEVLDSEEIIKEKEFNSKIMVNKKPYFFIYNYKQLMAEYNKFIKETNENAVFRFGRTYEEMLIDEDKTQDEKLFIESSKLKSPVFDNPCTMNKICHYFEKAFEEVKFKLKDDKRFNYKIYKSSNRKPNEELVNKVKEVYNNYRKTMREVNKKENRFYSEENDQGDINNGDRNCLIDYYKRRFAELGEPYKILDILIDLVYSSNDGRVFVWEVFGDLIIENLLKNNDNKIHVIKMDNSGKLKWCGENYTEETLEVM